jgi:hypothetical protein
MPHSLGLAAGGFLSRDFFSRGFSPVDWPGSELLIHENFSSIYFKVYGSKILTSRVNQLKKLNLEVRNLSVENSDFPQI